MLRMAYLDIENSPNLGYIWGKYEQNVIAYDREWNMMSFAYQWEGEKKVHCYALPDFPRYKKDRFDDSQLVGKLWEVFDEADIIIAHNGDRFDIRKSNTRFMKHDFIPPSHYDSIDTLKAARKIGFFNSNKLGDLATFLGIGQKLKTGGFDLWLDCQAGDEAAWAKMRRYNKQDVALLREVYYKLRPWMKNHPNITLDEDKPMLCPACGSADVMPRGWRYLKSYVRRQYRCMDCGKSPQGARKKLSVGVLD